LPVNQWLEVKSIMGQSYIFFNSSKPLHNGLEIEEGAMQILGKADDIKNLLNNNFEEISWEQYESHGKVTWLGSNSCYSDEYVDISINMDKDGNCSYVFFNKSCAKVLKKALSVLKTNNVFLDCDVQIINDL
jgi:hypothetical protein